MNSVSTLNLIHLANFNSTNIGNGALISGLESTVSEDLSCSVNWLREPWDDYTFGLVDFNEDFVAKVNSSDGLIVGGAVTFNGRDYNNRTGSRFELPFELWPKITSPVVFYGLSYRHWISQGQTYHHADKLKRLIETALEADNMIFSVRNDGTKKWIKDLLGIESDQIFEIPDSAVFVEHEEGHYYPELMDGVTNLMLSFNDEDADFRFDESLTVEGKSIRSREHVISELVSAVERLYDEFPLNIVLCPHYFDDYRMMSDFLERIRPRIAHQRMVSTGLCRVKDTGYFYGRYKKADLAMSMRVHSMSPCVGLGTPMMAYTTQDRMTDFMSRIGLQNNYVDAFNPAASDELYTHLKFAIENKLQVEESFQGVRANLREEARKFHSLMNDFLTA